MSNDASESKDKPTPAQEHLNRLDQALAFSFPKLVSTERWAIDFEKSKRCHEVTTNVLRFGRLFLPWNSNFDAQGILQQALTEYWHMIREFESSLVEGGRSGTWLRQNVAIFISKSEGVQTAMIGSLGSAVAMPDGIRWLDIPGFSELARLRDDLKGERQRLIAAMDEAKKLNQELKRDVRAKTTADQGQRFYDAADAARSDSHVWLGILITAAVALLLYVAFHFSGITRWEQMVPRLMVATVGYTILYWAIRNYSAAKHNQTVNLHRANSLETMRQFLLTEDAPDTRAEILSQAALSAFGQQPSGFIGGESAPDFSRIINNLQSGPSGKN